PALSARARAACPAVLRGGAGAGALIGIVSWSGRSAGPARLLAPDGRVVECDAAALARWAAAPAGAEARAGLDTVGGRAGLARPRAATVTDALKVAALGGERVAEGTRLRRARPSFLGALAAAGAGRRLGAAVAGYVAQLALIAGLWWIVGARALSAGGGSGVA